MHDIERIEGPDYQEIRKSHVDEKLEEERDDLAAQLAQLENSIDREGEIQKEERRSMDNARETMKQMMDLHRLSLEQGAPPSETETEALATAQQRFLSAQNKFEESNARITESNAERFQISEGKRKAEKDLALQEKPARDEYDETQTRHRLKLASFKLAFIVPLFLLSAFLIYRYRRSIYRPVFIAALGATFWHLARVMFDHFPREYFKYIAIVAGIITVIVFLVWLLRKASRPNRSLLLNRYREAYRNHTCAICAFPVARGPMRFAQWTKKGPVISRQAIGGETADDADEPYSCPSCGTSLYDTCHSCNKTRHSLLPFCEHCGDELEEAESETA